MHKHLKRELSTSVSDLHLLSTVSDSIKRLKITREGKSIPMPLTIVKPDHNNSNANLVHVMSNARDDFSHRYEIIKEVGKGGFSTVYQCRDRQTGADYAVKVVDLRPLRLRERFNPARLKREVEIMRRLHHPHIIQFIEVYEDPDRLLMVMEYCPGKELFDVILARKFFREEDAKPIFAQVAHALFYLHSLNIIHRDIKPENILILDHLDSHGNVMAKLLDFGLSKNAGGSEAKTFVGTPCYLAPEVEYTSKGLGGTYGLAADCWSLGAVLYVMLVARFPEFETDFSGKVVVKLAPALWQNVSNEAKDLIRALMNTNPNARLTMFGALQHPWLGRYRADENELLAISARNTQLNQELQEQAELEAEEEERMATEMVDGHDPELTAGGNVVRHHAMIIRQNDVPPNVVNAAGNGQAFAPENLKLAPLLHLQRSIAACFEEAHEEYHEYPEVASQIRRGAVLCRHQLVESTKMLRKVEQTAKEVLDMFPDLELAVEEDEPKLAAEFFNIVKEWVVELREQVTSTQKINKASMNQIQRVVEQSTVNLKESERKTSSTSVLAKQLVENLLHKIKANAPTNSQGQIDLANVQLDANSVLELFLTLFSGGGNTNNTNNIPLAAIAVPPANNANHANRIPLTAIALPSSVPGLIENGSPPNTSSSSVSSVAYSPAQLDNNRGNLSLVVNSAMDVEGKGESTKQVHSNEQNKINGSYSSRMHDIDEDHMSLPPPVSAITASNGARHPVFIDANDLSDNVSNLTEPNSIANNQQQLMLAQNGKNEVTVRSPRTPSNRLSEALQKLRQVDMILEQLGIFWANTEVVLDLLTKKGQHVEQFIGFSSKPRLMARFRERMEEYKRFWEGIRLMCANYVAGIQSTNESQKMYGFLEKNGSNTSDPGNAFGLGSNSAGGGSKADSIDGMSSPSLFFGVNGMKSTFDPIDEFKSLKVKHSH